MTLCAESTASNVPTDWIWESRGEITGDGLRPQLFFMCAQYGRNLIGESPTFRQTDGEDFTSD